MKEAFKEINFRADALAIIAKAEEICNDYMADGYTLTLRQLYYQFVARGLIENNIQSYKKIGSIVNDARLAGYLDWSAIEDRTRNLESLATWDSPASIVDACADQFKHDLWNSQPTRVEIWVEKEALIGVIERVATRYRVPYFACRGYTSQSEVYSAGKRFAGYDSHGQNVVVLHLGDHDPSGIDMTRDNDTRLELFGNGASIEVKRLALNHDQVLRYNPPPNPAKLTDSRASSYIKKFGDKSWELDALEPRVIDELISSNIEMEIDFDTWESAKNEEKLAKVRLKAAANTLR